MLRIDVEGVQRALRELRRIRAKSIPFALKAAADQTAMFGKREIQREWSRVLNARRSTFPRGVLRVSRSRFGRVDKPARLYNTEAGEKILRLQLRGGTRRPEDGKYLLIPVFRNRRKRRTNAYAAGEQGRRLLFASRKGPDVYIGALRRSVRVPRRFSLSPVLAKMDRIGHAHLLRAVRRELRRARARERR